jgi:hypothetical protein
MCLQVTPGWALVSCGLGMAAGTGAALGAGAPINLCFSVRVFFAVILTFSLWMYICTYIHSYIWLLGCCYWGSRVQLQGPGSMRFFGCRFLRLWSCFQLCCTGCTHTRPSLKTTINSSIPSWQHQQLFYSSPGLLWAATRLAITKVQILTQLLEQKHED